MSVSPDGKQRQLGLECLFRPLSNCSDYVQDRRNACAKPQGCPGSKEGLQLSRRPAKSKWTLDQCVALTQRYLMRPNARLADWLHSEYLRFWLDAGQPFQSQLISVHIRWGEKLIDGDLHPVSRYLDEVLKVVERHNIINPVVFLSSEDGSAIRLFEDAVIHDPRSAHIRVLSYNYTRLEMNCGGVNVSQNLGRSGSGLQGISVSSWASNRTAHYMPYRDRLRFLISHGQCAGDVPASSFRNRTGRSDGTLERLRTLSRSKHGQDLTMISLLNLYLALESSHIICLTASNWCWMLQRLADETTNLIVGMRDKYHKTVATQAAGGAHLVLKPPK